MIDREKLADLVYNYNKTKNAHLIGLDGVELLSAAREYDMSLPKTTQRIQLSTIGIDSSSVSENLEEIIEGLNLIGTRVLRRSVPNDFVVKVLDSVLDDSVPDIWNPQGQLDVIDTDPRGEFLSLGLAQLKMFAMSGNVSLEPAVLSIF